MLLMRDRLNLATRLLSLLSILLFTGVGVGFSMLDAVRYHGRDSEARGQAHYDPAGGCRDHAENCVLVFRGSTDRATAITPPETRFSQPVVESQPCPAVRAVFLATQRAPSSRAPPLLLA
jgi:hypothetical protein